MAKLVLIEWVDSHRREGWQSEKPATTPARCRSVGWLLHDGKNAKTIAPHVTMEGDDFGCRCGEMTIPTCAITRIKRICDKHERRRG